MAEKTSKALSRTFRYADGMEYRGQYREGERCGRGTLTHPNGDAYTGDFEDGVFHGYGRASAGRTGGSIVTEE